MTDQTKAYLYAMAAVAAWSTVASAFKLSLVYLKPVELLLYASVISMVVLGAVALVSGEWRQLRAWQAKSYLHSAALGALNPFLYYLVLFEAYHRLLAQEAQPLNYVWPIVLVVLSAVMLRERISLATIGAMLVSLVGVAVISTRGDVLGPRFTDTTGVLLALASTVIWASYWLLNKQDTKPAALRLGVNFAFGSAYILLYAALFQPVSWPTWEGLVGAVYVGCWEMGVTFLCWLQALRHSRTTAQISGLIFLAPFLSLVLIHFVLGEPIYPSSVVGLGLIVAGVIMSQRKYRA